MCVALLYRQACRRRATFSSDYICKVVEEGIRFGAGLLFVTATSKHKHNQSSKASTVFATADEEDDNRNDDEVAEDQSLPFTGNDSSHRATDKLWSYCCARPRPRPRLRPRPSSSHTNYQSNYQSHPPIPVSDVMQVQPLTDIVDEDQTAAISKIPNESSCAGDISIEQVRLILRMVRC